MTTRLAISKTQIAPPPAGSRRRVVLGALVAVAVFALSTLVIFIYFAGGDSWGAAPSGQRLSQMERSPHYRDGRFENPRPMSNDMAGAILGFLAKSPHAVPRGAVPVLDDARAQLEGASTSGLRVTWLGHSTLYIEIDGLVVLTDPHFSERASPFASIGPKRFFAPPIALADLPRPDVILLSHDHYDHLDASTIKKMRGWDVMFLAPLGVGAHLQRWGIGSHRIVELDWGGSTRFSGVTFVCTEARHMSGRHLFDRGRTLWSSWALLGPRHRAFFSGDTGMFPELSDIGERYGPFDVTMIEVGAYNRAWPDWHLGPEQAVKAHRMLRGRVMLPIHFGTFDLAMHGWTEPVERTVLAAKAHDVLVVHPRAGRALELGDPNRAAPPTGTWWPKLPFETAAQAPIVAEGLK